MGENLSLNPHYDTDRASVCAKTYTQSVNDFILNKETVTHCLKRISTKINSLDNTPETLHKAFQVLCIFWREVQQSKSLDPNEKKTALKRIDKLISEGLKNPNNDAVSHQTGEIAKQRHKFPYTSSIICKRIPHTPQAKYGMEIVDNVPNSEFAILVLGGDGTNTTASTNGYLKKIEVLLDSYCPYPIKPNLYGITYDWGETYNPVLAREFLAKDLKRFNKDCSSKHRMEQDRKYFKNYIAWTFVNYLSADNNITQFLKDSIKHKNVKHFLFHHLNNKNVQQFFLKQVPEKLFQDIFPKSSGITNREKFLNYISDLKTKKIINLLEISDIVLKPHKEETIQKVASLFLGYLENSNTKTPSKENQNTTLTQQQVFFETYLKDETLAAFWQEQLSQKEKNELHQDIKIIQTRQNALSDLNKNLTELLSQNKLTEQQLDLFFLQFLEKSDIKFFFLKHIDNPDVKSFLENQSVIQTSQQLTEPLSFKTAGPIIDKLDTQTADTFFQMHRTDKEVQKFLLDILQYKTCEKILLNDKVFKTTGKFEPITTEDTAHRFTTLSEYNNPRYIQEIFDNIFLPRLTFKGKRYQNVSQACINIRKITIMAHCHGAHVFMQLEKLMQQKMEELGYTPAERAQIQKQLVCIAQEPYCPLGASKSTMISFTSAIDPVVNYYNHLTDGYTLGEEIKNTTYEKQSKTSETPLFYFDKSKGNIFITPFISTQDCAEEHAFHISNDAERASITGNNAKKMFHFISNCLFNSLKRASSGTLLTDTSELFSLIPLEESDMKKNEKLKRKPYQLPLSISRTYERAAQRGETAFEEITHRIKHLIRFEKMLHKMATMDEATIQNLAVTQTPRQSHQKLCINPLLQANQGIR